MPSLEILDQRLRSSQTDQSLRLKPLPRAPVRRPTLDIPRTRRINRQHGHLGIPQGFNDPRKRFADLTGEGKTEDGVDNMVGVLECGVKVVGEGDFEVLQLLGEALVEVVFGSLGIVDCRFVAVMEEMASGDEAIAS